MTSVDSNDGQRVSTSARIGLRTGLRSAVPLMVGAGLVVGACTTAPAADSPTAPAAVAAPLITTEASVPDPSSTDNPIRLTVNGADISGTLSDNPSADQLLARLPLMLTVRDFNGVEKTADLPSPLTVDGVPRGADPELFDIGYYAPDQVLVLYYGEVGFYNGIVRLGRFDPAAADLIQNLPDGDTITLTAG